jgi:dihydroorotase
LKIVFNNFHIVDAFTDITGTVFVEGGRITSVTQKCFDRKAAELADAGIVFDGYGALVLTGGFVDMHAHFREPGFSEKETLESASIAAVRGGYTSVVCMANTNPVIDNAELAAAIKRRADELGLISLYPAVSLTEGMRGKKLSPYLLERGFSGAARHGAYRPPLLSEDGKDVADDELFIAALARAAEAGAVVSCHCDIGGEDAAVERALRLHAAERMHIAHVSTQKAAALLRRNKAAARVGKNTALSAEATPHHIALTELDADAFGTDAFGADTFGKVAPPLRGESDRLAVIEALRDGTIDAIATDHAPHTFEDKRGGAPGFSGLETAFPVCNTVLVKQNGFSLKKLFSLLSAEPARILGLKGAGAVVKGVNADIVILDTETEITIDSKKIASRGKNTLFTGKKFSGSVILTMHDGKIVYQM